MIKIISDILSQLSLIASTMLAAICWFNQFIIYPELREMNEKNFINLHKRITKAMFTLFLPLMMIETFSFFSMLRLENDHTPNEWLLSAFLLIILWIVNFVLVLRIHTKLDGEKHEKLLNELSILNWFRIFLWISKSVIFYFYFG
jgi:hypothetical protein